MIYKKQFHQLPYGIKKRAIFQLLLLFWGENLANKLLTLYGLSISVFPFYWLIFTKKYFKFYVGLGLFSIGFVFYFCFYHFTFLQFLFTAIAVFYIANFTDIDKLSAFLAFFVQNVLFTFFDFHFNPSAFIQSSLLSLMFIAIARLDPIPSNTCCRESVFL
jgi:hypothetical protein